MSEKKDFDKNENIQEKLDYLGLDLDKIPKQLLKYEPLNFRISKFYDENHYRQYRYIPIKDIQIFLTPTNRLDEISEKYKKSSPISEYLDSKNEENILKYTTFLNMLKNFNIEDVEKIKEEQLYLNKKIPFKVKFNRNYLWQIYYSENTDKYFMLVPTEDSDYSAFFFLLKKQLEKRRSGKIFVPVRNVGYSNKYLSRMAFEDIENYLWLFTKGWPLIYEVYDKNDELTIQIVGETYVYDKVKSEYKNKLKSKEEANNFYKLLKAMFILQTELPNYFKFDTSISKSGEIEFYNKGKKIEYDDMPNWINEEYSLGEENIETTKKENRKNKIRLKKLKEEVAIQEIEYLAKEKQISTFLECKKTFFGKFKYYFKYSKKSNKNKIRENSNIEEKTKRIESKPENKSKTKLVIQKEKKENYTIEELVELYSELEKIENTRKNLLMDINALKLKKKNMEKKLQNATNYIKEIDKHKKSIFEFWKYSNKDEMASLPEGEEEEVNVVKKITKVFDYEEDLEDFGKKMDRVQRRKLSKTETDSIFITTTNLIDILNKVKKNEILPKEIEASLKELKKESNNGEYEFDIFGGIGQDSTKVSEINNKKHREIPKDKFNILDINKNSKQIGYKLSLEKVIENIKKALKEITVVDDLPVYMLSDEKIDDKNINIFNINPKNEILKLSEQKGKSNFYKINLKQGSNAISFTNCIFYDNQNKTLPLGQNLSTRIMVDVSKLDLKLVNKTNFKVVQFEDEKDEFSKIIVKQIDVYEYDVN